MDDPDKANHDKVDQLLRSCEEDLRRIESRETKLGAQIERFEIEQLDYQSRHLLPMVRILFVVSLVMILLTVGIMFVLIN